MLASAVWLPGSKELLVKVPTNQNPNTNTDLDDDLMNEVF